VQGNAFNNQNKVVKWAAILKKMGFALVKSFRRLEN
jgi:hypothetical protein